MHTALLLEMAAGALGDRVATGSADGGVSYDELAARARAGGHWLAAHEAANVVFVGLNGAALPTALFAAAEIGKPVRAAELPPARTPSCAACSRAPRRRSPSSTTTWWPALPAWRA